jgi:hypothetical protein
VEVGRKKVLVLVGSYCVRWEALLITTLVANKRVVAWHTHTHTETQRERERERERERLWNPQKVWEAPFTAFKEP